MFVSSLEVGGIIGSVTAGFMADRLVALVSLPIALFNHFWWTVSITVHLIRMSDEKSSWLYYSV
jgi:sugar phosphate permease